MLIQITDDVVVDSSAILHAMKVGGNTEVRYRIGVTGIERKSVPDGNWRIWNQIVAAAKAEAIA